MPIYEKATRKSGFFLYLWYNRERNKGGLVSSLFLLVLFLYKGGEYMKKSIKEIATNVVFYIMTGAVCIVVIPYAALRLLCSPFDITRDAREEIYKTIKHLDKDKE